MNSSRSNKHLIFLAIGVVGIFLSFVVMCGWFFNVQILISVLPDYPTMKFNTALAMAFCSVGLILVHLADNKPAKYFYYAFSTAIFLIGILTLAEVIFDINLGIDQLFFLDLSPPDGMSPYPGRMVGSSALSFSLFGQALLGVRSSVNRIRHLAQYGLHLVTFFATMALMAYYFQLSAAYKVAHFTSMAIHTSMAFLALSVTLSFYNSNMGLTGLFTGKGLGNEMARKLFPAIALTGLLLGYVRIKMFHFHFVSLEFGVAFSVIILSLTTLLWIWITAMQLNKLEGEKKQTDEANYKLNLDIAAAQKLEKQKDEINKRNLLFVQQAPSAIAMFDTEMRYIAASEQWIKDYGLQGLDIIGQSHYDIFPEIGDDWKVIHQKCLKGEIDKCDESRFVRADGSEQWITWDVRPWYNSENEVGGLLIYTAEISHLKKNEVLLKEISESLADAQEIAHVGSWDWNLVTNGLKWSDEQYRIFGFEPGSVIPSTGLTYSLVHPDDKEKMVAAGGVRESGKPYASEFRIIRPDGGVRDIEARGRTILNGDGKVLRIIGTSADITERKKLERDLLNSEREFRHSFENSAIGMALVSFQGRFMRVNQELAKMVGYTQDEMINMPFAKITHPVDVQENVLNLKRLFNGDIDKYIAEKRYVHKNGNIVWISLTVSVVFDEQQVPQYMVSQMKDISQRKKLERELMISELEFRNAFENSASGMTLVSPDLKWLKINEEFCNIVGYSEAELRQMTFADITHPDDVADNVLNLKRLAKREIERYQAEKRYIHKNGSIVWAILTVSAVFDSNDVVIYFVGQITDITEDKKMESKLQRLNSELASIFNAETHVSIISTDLAGIITHFSKGAEVLLGYKASELIGHFTPAVFHDPFEVEARGRELSTLLSRDVQGFDVFVTIPGINEFESREWTYMHKDGSRLPVQLVVSQTKDEKGNINGYLGIATDISERKEAEEAGRNYAVLQSRNKEMEEFAYIASHDLQEPLRTVTGFVRLLASEYSEQLKGDGEQYVRFIAASTSRMSDLIKGLLEFSRIGKQKTAEPVDCNRVMQAVVDDLAAAIQENEAVIVVDELPVINGLPTEMKQLFQNLIGNAIKFRKPDVPPLVHVSAKPLPGYWQFEVSDNGLGINPKYYEKIFILFQRLHGRDIYPGTGIGLSYCKKIVELHHGRIWVESEPGAGSRFFFTISNYNM